MKLLFVWPAAEFSVWDVARGYRSALERQGHEVVDYLLNKRMAYHYRALPDDQKSNTATLSRQASENVINEALYNRVDAVVIISGLNLHPIAIWGLQQVAIPAAIVLTESPYDDVEQLQWVNNYPGMAVFTNEATSATQYGWHHLPPAFDPVYHRPVAPDPDMACDVLMVGTGFSERIKLLEAVDWAGVNLKLMGLWPQLSDNLGSPLRKFLSPLLVDNTHIAQLYCSAKICLNIHRSHFTAQTPNPRVYETAACGAFQLSDRRQGLVDMFGISIPTFAGIRELEDRIRMFLSADGEAGRLERAATALARVQDHTFDSRARELVRVLESTALQSAVSQSVKLGLRAQENINA